jgi:hypothetical protein
MVFIGNYANKPYKAFLIKRKGAKDASMQLKV